jgi:fumagillin biosynthesis dioxygenase
MDQVISDAGRVELATNGWCVIADVIPRETAAEGVERLWSAVEANARDGYSCHLPGIDPNASMVRIMSPLWSDGWFRALVQNETALSAAATVIGDDFILNNCTANIALPGSDSMALHSDLASILPEPWIHRWSVNVMWCLTDVHPANGATLCIPGSHLWTTRADIPEDAMARLVPFEAKAGSIIIVDGRLWHTSGRNVTRDEQRALLFAYYSVPYIRPMINWTALIPAEEQATFPPKLRNLLGLDVFANTVSTEKEGQGHWRGMPVGAERALADCRRARDATMAGAA